MRAENEVRPGEQIIRIRRTLDSKDGSRYYHHADVIVLSEEEATQAANEGRITNWRWIDRFETGSTSDYVEYELYPLDITEARKLARPMTQKEKAQHDKRLEKLRQQKAKSKVK
jgi:hypothetical protein